MVSHHALQRSEGGTTHRETFPPEEGNDGVIDSKLLSFLQQRAVDVRRVSQVCQRLTHPGKIQQSFRVQAKNVGQNLLLTSGVSNILVVLVVFQSSKQIDKHGSEEFVIVVPLLRDKQKTVWPLRA